MLIWTNWIKDTHQEKEPSNETPVLRKSINIGLWVVGTPNQFFIRGSWSLFLLPFIFFAKWKPFKNYKKCFLFHIKNSFHSLDIQIFVFPSFHLYLPVGHCFRGLSKINLKVYDIINCLNENLIAHFVWYFDKEKRCDTQTLPIVRVLNKKHF